MNQAVLRQVHPEHVEVELYRADELAQCRGLMSELDEMWSDVGKKAEPRWFWHAIEHHSGALAYAQLATYAGWQEQALQLRSLERQYVKDLARDHVWRFDKSPARVLKHQQSMARTFALAMGARQPTRPHSQERTPTHHRVPMRHQLRELAAALERADEAPAGAALRVRLYEREREEDRGLGW